jgi:ADP-ribose pyrophosphatase
VIELDVLKLRTSSGQKIERELIKHRGAAVIVPVRSDGRLVLIRQLRIATGKWIWEFPAGTLEKGESVIQCAKRELIEETGWQAGRIRKVLEFFPTPGISTEKMYLFIADRLKRAAPRERDADEELEVAAFPVSQIERMIRRRQIIDGKTILGFLFFQRSID